MNRNDELPVGYLLKRAEGDIYFEAKWRDSRGTQRKRRLGKAWLVKTEDGYERRRGWVCVPATSTNAAPTSRCRR